MMFHPRNLFTALICFSSFQTLAQANLTALPDRSKDAAAMYVDAVKARMLDDVKQEESLLKEVIRLQPQQAAPYHDLAKLYLKQRKFDQAENLINKAVERDGENLWYLVTSAEIFEAQSKPAEAAAIYKKLAAKERFNKEYIFHASRLYESAGNYKEAIGLIDQLMQKMGNEEILLRQKQQLYLRLNDIDNAVKVAEQLISQSPLEGRYYTNLADIYNNNGHPEKAVVVFEKALKQLPDDPNIQFGAARFYRGKGDTLKYEEYIRKAILNREFDDETQATVLVSYLQDLDSDTIKRRKGITLTRQLAEMHPNNAQIVNLYGDVLVNNGETELAKEQYKIAVTLDPSRFVAWQRLLFSSTDRKEADSLIKYSEKAMRLFPNQALVHYLNGIGHFNKGAFSAAGKSINRAIDLQPEDNSALLADMYAILGDVYHSDGKSKESDEAYEKALQLNPQNATVLNNYAYYLSERGIRLNDAEKMSKKSLEIRPDEATFLDTYGWILYRQGNYQKSKEYIQRALDKNPDSDGTLYDHLGDIYFKLNDVDKAVELWKKAKEKGTDNKQIDKKINERKLYE